MTAAEMVAVARLADHYEKRLAPEYDPLEAATHAFSKFKRDAPELWRVLRESDRSDRQIGDWLAAFFDRATKSGMSLKNFAADELDRITAETPKVPEPTAAMYAALQMYANLGGRTWKSQLIADWASNQVDSHSHASELHQVRNIFGPTWLRTHCKIRPR